MWAVQGSGRLRVWVSLRCHGDTITVKYPSTSQTREATTPWPPTGFSSEWLVNMGGPIPRHHGNSEKACPW